MSTLNKRERTGAGLAGGSVLLVGGSVAASSMLNGYPVLGGQAVRYLAAGLLLAAWARLQHKPLPRPTGREWAWLAALAVIGLAGCSVLMIQATRAADPASVGVIIGAAPLVIIIAAAITARRRPTGRVLLAAAVVTAGSAAAQLGGATGPAFSPAGLAWSAGALAGAVGISLLAAPVLPRLGALAVTVYACGLAGLLLLAAAAVARSAGGPPILRTPSPAQLAALAYLTIAVTALVFIAWYGAMERLGVDRTGLFNGLIPVTSLAAVALTGTGTITPLGLLGALSVLAGVILGLSRAPQASAGPDQTGRRPQPTAETTPIYFELSVRRFPVIATDNPNLSAFERHGGKILIWHGLADQLIFPQGTIQYYQRVQHTLGAQNTATFARLFLAPGAQHCAPAAGPTPANPLQAVVHWVEYGQAPATILATGGVNPSTSQPTQRPLCRYPYLSEYVSGNPDSLSSYTCVLLTPAQQRQLTALN